MSNVIQLVKDSNHPLSDVELYQAFMDARMMFTNILMTNVYDKSAEEMVAINKMARRANEEYASLYIQCLQRGIV